MSSLSIIGSDSSFISYSDNAMAGISNATDKAKISSLKSENEKLQEELNQLSSENQSLQGQINQFKSASKVEISDTKGASIESREITEKSKEFAVTNNVNYAYESANFSKQSIQSQAGSMLVSQANANSANVQKLVSQ